MELSEQHKAVAMRSPPAPPRVPAARAAGGAAAARQPSFAEALRPQASGPRPPRRNGAQKEETGSCKSRNEAKKGGRKG